MPEEIKDKICEFLKQNKGKEFTIRKLRGELEQVGIKYCYPTILKWVSILGVEPDSNVQVRDFGSLKLVSYEKEEKIEVLEGQ